MKMPFGKYKGTELNNLKMDYIRWLLSIELKNPLKDEIQKIAKSDRYQSYLDTCSKLSEQAQQFRDEQEKLEQDYIKDIKFWGRVSPNSVIETIRKNNIDVDSDTWKWVLRNADKTSF
jgi:hypothetical protein